MKWRQIERHAAARDRIYAELGPLLPDGHPTRPPGMKKRGYQWRLRRIQYHNQRIAELIQEGMARKVKM